MRFSIIIPVFNTEQYLPQCLDSILSQSFGDFEVICVDDGSTDASVVLLESYAGRDARVKVLRNTRKGVSSARNTGLSVASGDYIMFVDSDDWILPDALDLVNLNLDGDKYDMLVYATRSYIEADKRHISCYSLIASEFPDGWSYYESASGRKAYNVFGTIWGKIYSHRILASLSFLETVSYHEDMLFAIDACSRAGLVIVIPDSLYVYRVRETGSQMATYCEKRFLDMVRVANYLVDEYMDVRKEHRETIFRTAASYYRNGMAWSKEKSHPAIRNLIDWRYFRKASCISIKAYLSFIMLKYVPSVGLFVLDIAYKKRRAEMERQIVSGES